MPARRPLRAAAISVAVTIATVVTACGSDGSASPTSAAAPASVSILAAPGPMASFGETRTLAATVLDARGTSVPNAAVGWTTSDSTVVRLSAASGASVVATARGNGRATIVATSSAAAGQLDLAVAQALASATLQPAAPTVAPGGTQALTVIAMDALHGVIASNAPTLAFQSSNAGVATVDALGVVRGVADGTATITATVTLAGLTRSATSAVTVGATAGGFPSSAIVQAPPSSVFTPAVVDVAAGGTVTWAFGSVTHNVTFDAVAGVPANVPNSASRQVARTFGTPGVFPYECTIHPGMTGQVKVH